MTSKVHEDMGGDATVIEAGGVVQVKSGGRVHLESGGLLTVASGAALNVEAGGKVQQAGVNLPASVSLVAAAGASTVCEVTISVKDAAGAVIAETFNLDIWLSDSADGAGLTTTTASGAVAAKASSGVDLVTLVTKKALRVQTKANGIYVLSITDSAKTAFYVCGQAPGTGRTNVGTRLITANYG